MFKHKLIALAVTAHARLSHPHAPEVLLYGPTADGRYAIPGEGYVATRNCTVTADGMRARVEGRFVTFLDRDGQEEGQCELGHRPVVRAEHAPIRRSIGTVTP